MSVWLNVVTGLIAAVIGGVISPQLAQTKDRRAARAAVREKLEEVEASSWNTVPYREYMRAVAALEAAAIVARVPRAVTERYTRAADEARRATETYDDDNGPISVLMDKEKAEAVRVALDDLSRALWHPWVSRMTRLGRKRG